MNIRFVFRGMESSVAIEKYITEKNKKLERILTHEREPLSLEVILESHPVHAQFAVELRLHAGDYHVRAQKDGTDIYGLLDMVFDVLVQEIRKEKEKDITKREDKTKREII